MVVHSEPAERPHSLFLFVCRGVDFGGRAPLCGTRTPAAAMFLRHTQLFLWKNSLQKARNPGQTCCELLTPVILVALFALLCVCRAVFLIFAAAARAAAATPAPPPTPPRRFKYANLNTTPDTTFECSPVHTFGGASRLVSARCPCPLSLSLYAPPLLPPPQSSTTLRTCRAR